MMDAAVVDSSSSQASGHVPSLTPPEFIEDASDRPIEFGDDGFQNESDQEMLGQDMHIGTTEGKYVDDSSRQRVEENIVTTSSTETWDDQNGNNRNEESKRSDDDENSKSTQHSRTTSSNRLGSCSSCLRRLIVRVCRPHIQSPCCLSSPRLPKCLKNISPRKRQIICRSLIIIFMIITITFVCLDLIFLKRYLHSWLQSLLEFMEEKPGWGGLCFVGIFVIASLCFFPVPLLSLGAGFVYIELYGLGVGICVSFFVCYIGYLVGAAICFARSRYLMRRLIVRFSNKYPVVRAVDRAFETMGFRIFLLLRLSPAMPFNALNYIGGITAIKFKDYCLATSVGIIPGLIWTIFVGATFGTVGSRGVDGNKQLDEKSAVNKGIVLGLGIGLGIAGLIGTGIYARRELTKIIIAEQQAREVEEQAALRFSSSSLEEGVENPQSGCDEDNLSLATFEETSIARSRRESFHSIGDSSAHITPSLSQDEDISLTMTLPARRRNWTADNIAAELPIVPVVSPFFRMMKTYSETPRDDEGVELRRTGSTGAISPSRTQALGALDEDRALSFRNQQRQQSFLHGGDYEPVSNRRRCETDPYAYAPSQKQFDVPSDVKVEEKKGDVEIVPKRGLMKLFQGLSVPSSADFPRFNRRRCNSDPNEAEKRAATIDVIALDLEAGLDYHRRSSSSPLSNRNLPQPLHVDDEDAVERPLHQRMRSASMNELNLEKEEADREWFWLFA